jgi:uncharacterized protein DUF2786
MERIAERIRKLLALASNNPSEAEAAIALERASALMAEHNLTVAQVDARGTGEERVEEKHNAAYKQQTWAREIWGSVAELNFCMWWYHHSNRKYGWHRTPGGSYEKGPPREVDEHVIIGTRSNVETTKAMVDYLISTIERLARESKLESQRDLHAFKLGCAQRLSVRLDLLREKRAEAKKRRSSVRSTLPALADLYAAHEQANADLYAKIHGGPPRFTSGSPLGTSSLTAYESGQSAGSKVSLDTQIARAGRVKLLGRNKS